MEKSPELVIGRQYHLNQINKSRSYILKEILPNGRVLISPYDKKSVDRIVRACKLLPTMRHIGVACKNPHCQNGVVGEIYGEKMYCDDVSHYPND